MNESDDFYTDFDINQRDVEEAMAMGSGRHRRQTKEKQIYGVFASSSDDDEERERPGFSGSKKRTDYAAPVSFISGGVQKGNKFQTEEDDKKEDNNRAKDKQPEAKRRKHYGRGGDVNNTFAGVGDAQAFAGMRNAAAGGRSDGGGATWAKTSGKGSVIMEMMKNMGYTGKGLGSKEQGIIEPIQVFVRPGRGAIGAYGKEAQGPKFGESAAEAQNRLARDNYAGSNDENYNDDAPKQGNWKKSNVTRKQKIRYRTLDDIVAENDSGVRLNADGARQQTLASTGGMGGVKIIDMTGPEQKVYNDFNSFTRRARAPDMESDRNKFDIPELMSNLNMLVDFTEEEIFKSDQQIRFLKDQTEVLRAEQKRLRAVADEQKLEITHMTQIAEIIKDFQRVSATRSPTLEECRELFGRLRHEYPVEYKLYGLEALASASILPALRAHFAVWDPLDPEQINYGFAELTHWRDILSGTTNAANGSSSRGMFERFRNDTGGNSAFDYCVWEGWMPAIRRAALTWSPRDNSPAMMALVELWLPLLPPWIAENLLDQIIVPRIKAQVDEWDPRLDPVPIDSWLVPWRFIMGDRLMLVYSIIRQKLKKGLENWRPGDRSAIESILPWKEVFSAGAMHSFLGMSIVPKLEMALQNININTAEHFNLLELHDWLELIHADIMCQILVRNFFPRFHQCMYGILMSPHMSVSTAEDYYRLWRNTLPDVVKTTQIIRNEFGRALMTLKQAQQGLPVNMPMGMPPTSAMGGGFIGNVFVPPPQAAFMQPSATGGGGLTGVIRPPPPPTSFFQR